MFMEVEMGRGLTDRQREVLECIQEAISETGYPPTIREIGDRLGIRSTNGVNDHLKALERKGYLERDTSKSRAMLLTERALRELPASRASEGQLERWRETVAKVPMLGRIAAGPPMQAIAQSDSSLALDLEMLGMRSGEGLFALQVSGESMIEAGILDGDLIFVKRQEQASRGEMVAVMVDGAATVKRYYPEGDRIRLQPENSSMEPIWVRADEARETLILGRVVGVWRRV